LGCLLPIARTQLTKLSMLAKWPVKYGQMLAIAAPTVTIQHVQQATPTPRRLCCTDKFIRLLEFW
jgi:hypothetical protein